MVDLVWHRTDIRCTDNTALNEATAPIPLVVFDPTILEQASDRRIAWWRENVQSLKDAYQKQDADLVVTHDNPVKALRTVVDRFDVDRVLWNRDYSGLAQRRDERVREALDVPTVVTDDMLEPPNTITTNKGEPYSVFTYYNKKWQQRPKDSPYEKPTEYGITKGEGQPVPSLDTLNVDAPAIELPPTGTDAARERLKHFVEADIEKYDELRDYPAEEITSRLSAYRSYGIIGPRTVWAETERAIDIHGQCDGIETFREQLAWDEFYTEVLFHNPDVVTSNYKAYENEINWRTPDDELEAWKNGETGYPIVDAGMRQLKEEGWMHNRVRMIVASFLTKDMLVDWRHGYDWFRQQLLDHNTANDNGGWQWAASTGTDAQPYFRIFNPMTQGEDYDPEAEYIKEYVPELADVPAETIHEWPSLDDDVRQSVDTTYPDPILDHSERREEALAMFKRARGEDPDN